MTTYIISIFTFLSATSSIKVFDNDRTSFLTNSDQKTWHLLSVSTEPKGTECSHSDEVSKDNIYVFHANGTFEFTNGKVTESPSCEECCSDFINFIGKWTFTKNQKGLRVTALYEKDNRSNELDTIVFDAAIQRLDEEVLTLTQIHSENQSKIHL